MAEGTMKANVMPPNTACSHNKTSEVFIDILAVADG
jgi:hypothetical protein